MSATTPLPLTVPVERALPRQAMIFFVVSPPVLALLFDPNCVMDASHVSRAVVTITVFTIITGLGVHLSFDWLAQRLRDASWLVRLPAHAALCVAVVGALTLVQFPLVTLVYPEASDAISGIFWRSVIVSFVYLSVAAFVAHLLKQAVRERVRAHEERAAGLEARIAMLQAQLQPHFLFNSLNVCAGLVHEDVDAAERTLDTLAGFLRYTLESTERRLVRLDEELEAVGGYLEVQRQRFGDRLEYELEIDDDARGWQLPPMTLQPLVENALHHGLGDRARGGRIAVRAAVRGGERVLWVEDDGVGQGRSKHRGTGTGMRNVAERLRLVLGDGAGLSTEASSLGGFRAVVTLGGPA